MNLENIMLTERNQMQKVTYLWFIWFHLYEMTRIGKSTEIENILVIARSCGWGGWRVTADEYGFFFWSDENVLKLDSGELSTENHWIVHFKMVIFYDLMFYYLLFMFIIYISIMLLGKLSSPISFYLFNVAIRKFWIIYVAHIIFLLDSVVLDLIKKTWRFIF